MRSIYVADLTMECKGDYRLEAHEKDAKQRPTQAEIPRDLRNHEQGAGAVKVRYACSDEVGEREVTLGRIMRYVVELLR